MIDGRDARGFSHSSHAGWHGHSSISTSSRRNGMPPSSACGCSSKTARKFWGTMRRCWRGSPNARNGNSSLRCRRRMGALAAGWWIALLLRGVLPAVFAIAMGVLVARRPARDRSPVRSRSPAPFSCCSRSCRRSIRRVSANLGDRTAAWLYDRLTAACVRPPGMGHLEDPTLTGDLTVARDFDLGMTGPPLSISMDFIAGGLVETDRRARVAPRARRAMPGGRRSCWPAPGWPRTGCLRESAVWRDRNTDEVRARAARRRVRLPPGRRSARQQGAAAVRPGRLDARPLRRPPHPPARAAVRRRRGCASGR